MPEQIAAPSFAKEPGILDRFRPLIEATGGLTLAQVCSITGLESSTTQNWIKRGFVPHPVGKKYFERHLARFLLIDALRDGMLLDEIGALLQLVNGDTDDESDDIITESALYELFCNLTRRAGEVPPSESGLTELVRKAVAETGAEAQAAKRLEPALLAMLCAYTSGWYRRRAEESFHALEAVALPRADA